MNKPIFENASLDSSPSSDRRAAKAILAFFAILLLFSAFFLSSSFAGAKASAEETFAIRFYDYDGNLVITGEKAAGESYSLAVPSAYRGVYTDEEHEIVGWSLTPGGARKYLLTASYSADADLSLYPVTLHKHGGSIVQEWTDPELLPDSGAFYLETDVSIGIDSLWEMTGDLVLCLNGHSLSFEDFIPTVSEGKSLSIYGESSETLTLSSSSYFAVGGALSIQNVTVVCNSSASSFAEVDGGSLSLTNATVRLESYLAYPILLTKGASLSLKEGNEFIDSQNNVQLVYLADDVFKTAHADLFSDFIISGNPSIKAFVFKNNGNVIYGHLNVKAALSSAYRVGATSALTSLTFTSSSDPSLNDPASFISTVSTAAVCLMPNGQLALATSYSITYSGAEDGVNGVSNPNPTVYAISAEDLVLQSPEKTGYTFVGWKASEEEDPQATLSIPAGDSGDKTFIAVWTPTVYSITYLNAANGEDGVLNENVVSYTVESGEILLSDPSRAGYAFGGWEGFAEGAASIPAGSYGDKVFTALWEAYRITKQPTESDLSVLTNAPIEMIESYAWYRGENALQGENGATFSDFSLIEGDAELYCVIALTDGTVLTSDRVRVHAHDGALFAPLTLLGSENGNYYLSADYTLSSPIFLSDASVAIDLNGYALCFTGSGSLTVGSDASLTLTNCRAELGAICLLPESTLSEGIVTVLEGGTLFAENIRISIRKYVSSFATLSGATEWANVSVVSENEAVVSEFITARNTLVSLFGFSYQDPISVSLLGSESLLNLGNSACSLEICLGDGARFCVKEALDSPVTVRLLDATAYSEGQTVVLTKAESEEEKENNDLSNILSCAENGGAFFLSSEGESAGQIVFAKNAVIRVYDEGALIASYEKRYGESVFLSSYILPTKERFRQVGWLRYGEEQAIAIDAIYSANESLSIEAVWERFVYSITYAGEFDLNQNPDSYSVDFGLTLRDPARAGYEFSGWILSEGDSPVKNYKIEAGETGDRAFTAVWRAVTYSITYAAAADGVSGVSNSNPTAYSVQDEDFILENPSRVGYEFVRWQGYSVGEEPVVRVSSAEDLIFTALWRAIEYTITYEDAENEVIGLSNPYPTSYSAESESFTIGAPERYGFRFLSWIYGGEKIPSLTVPAGSTGNILLTAEWELLAPEARFESYGATYDGEEHLISVSSEHALSANGLTARYFLWKDDNSEQELSSLAFPVKNVSDSGNYKIRYALRYTDGKERSYEKSGYLVNREGEDTIRVSIDRAPLTVSPDRDLGKTYGEADAPITYSVSGALSADPLALTGALSRESGENAGEYEILLGSLSFSRAEDAENYEIRFVSGVLFEIAKKTLVVRWGRANYTYNGAVQTAIRASADTGVSGETLRFTVREKNGKTIKNAGSYVLVAECEEGAENYVLTNNENPITVQKANLTVRVKNENITYGDPIPAFTPSIEGFAPGEGQEALSGTLAVSCDYAQKARAGKFPVDLSGLSSDNYEIFYAESFLTVAKRELTLFLTAQDGVQGALSPASATVDGMLEGDAVTVRFSYQGANYPSSELLPTAAGEYRVTAFIHDDNYYAEAVSSTFTLKAAEVRAQSATGAQAVLIAESGVDPNGTLSLSDAKEQTVSRVREYLSDDQTLSSVYDVSLLVSGEEEELDEPVLIKIEIPLSLRGKAFSVLKVSDSEIKQASYTVEGDFAVIRADSLDAFAFVSASEKEDSFAWLIIVLSVLLALGIAFAAIILLSHRKLFQSKNFAFLPYFFLAAALPAGQLTAIWILSSLVVLVVAADVSLVLFCKKKKKAILKRNAEDPSLTFAERTQEEEGK